MVIFVVILVIILVFYLVFKFLFKTQIADDNTFDPKTHGHGVLIHTSGLPLPQGVFVDVSYNEERILFHKDNTNITISKDKIWSIDRTTGQALHDQAAGAVAGNYIVGGAGGAILGAIIATKFYIVISYNSGGEDKYIVLDEANSGFFGSRLTKDFSKTTTTTQANRNIEL